MFVSLYIYARGLRKEYLRFINVNVRGVNLKTKSTSLKVHFTDQRGNKEINRSTDLRITAFRCHYHVPIESLYLPRRLAVTK